jgi:mRNA interferase YafQ
MRTIKHTTKFKRDYKRILKGIHRAEIDDLLKTVVAALASDQPLPQKHQDHPLSGRWASHRDCHVKPDLVLIYRKPDAQTLELVRLGSHSELSF